MVSYGLSSKCLSVFGELVFDSTCARVATVIILIGIRSRCSRPTACINVHFVALNERVLLFVGFEKRKQGRKWNDR